ncbi:hypothetical protein [Clostridium sp. MD294]|uniref:hypothetical protein n=1 Tax=Clostridium sp. MD294 TaxID=97138 RepID=UPI0002CA234D|nr:hypothetical protein [Clostridium sp. MD294]NDO46741.1 hypothetical protein [Clostridium sp. MD294]USF28818.1 hypothetical protein C820_000192 [Clostridium sp. MD294]
MKINKREQRKRRIAAIVAILLVIAMVLSLIAPIFSARAMAAPAVAVDTASTILNDDTIQNDAALSEKQKKEREVGINDFSANILIGFEQQFIVGKVVPVSAVMVNNSNDFKGEFQIKIYSTIGNSNNGGRYSIFYQPLELSKGAIKQIYLSVPIQTIQKDFEITLVNEKNQIVYRKYVSAQPLDPATILIGVLSERPADMAYLSALHFAQQQDYTGEYTKTVYLNNETFPSEQSVINHFKVIVIDDFDTKSLSEKQKQALLQWIQQGGICVIGTGVNASKTMSGLQNIVSITSESTVQKNIILAGQSVRADVAELNLLGIEDIQTDIFENASLLAIGNGAVILYDISLSLEPVISTAGFVNEIKSYCEYVDEELMKVEYADSYNYNPMSYIAQRFPELKENSIYIILFAVIIYVIVIGPILYIVLKRKDKREFAWIAIPAISAIFMLIIFVLSINSQYKSGLINIVSATKIEQGQNIAKTEIYGCAKSNKKGTVVLSAEKAMNLSVASEDRWNYYEEAKDIYLNKVLIGDKTEITYFNKGSWNNNEFEMQTVTDMGGTVVCDVKMEGEKLVGTITNNTNRNFKDILFVVGKRIIKIDSLKIGESININEEIVDKQITNLSSAVWEIFRDVYDRTKLNKKIKSGEMTRQDAYRIMREGDLVQDYVNWNEAEMRLVNEGDMKVYLYAFDEEGILPEPININGESALENTLNLYIMEYSVYLSEAEMFEIPYGVLSGIVLLEESADGINDYRDNSIYAETASEAVWTFGIPANTQIESVQFRSLNDTGNFYQAPEIYNAATEQWEALSSDPYNDISNYIWITEDYPNGCIKVKYFVQKETEVRYPEMKIKGAGQNVRN